MLLNFIHLVCQLFPSYKKTVNDPKVFKVIKLYSDDHKSKIFSGIRFWDSPTLMVEKLLPKKGVVLDLGCGEGINSNYFAICSNKRNIIGLDLDEKRIKVAQRGLRNTVYKKADVANIEIPKANTVVMFHLLHHLPSYRTQEQLILKVVKSLETKDKLIVVEINKELSLKYFVTWIVDHLIFSMVFDKRIFDKDVYFRTKKEWLFVLNKYFKNCRVIDAKKGKPFSHIIFECIK